ncbi:hypothetical protein SLA2020_037990 [Shorea laevis]
MDLNSSSPQTIPIISTFSSPFDQSPPINNPNSASTRKPISLWLGMYHSPVTTTFWEARSKIFERLLDPPKDAPLKSKLLTKTPS